MICGHLFRETSKGTLVYKPDKSQSQLKQFKRRPQLASTREVCLCECESECLLVRWIDSRLLDEDGDGEGEAGE